MVKHRQCERRLGDEKIAAHKFERRAGWVGDVFVIAGGDDAQLIDLDRNLRRAQYMAGRMQRDLGPGEIDAFAVSQGLRAAGESFAVAQPHQIECLLRRQHRAMAGAGVIGMGMSDDGAFHRSGGIDMKAAALAANPGGRMHQDVFRTGHA